MRTDEFKILAQEICKANFHDRGLKCANLYTLETDFFAKLKEEVLQIPIKYKASDVTQQNHVTNWTKPEGVAVQFSLLNTSGDFHDTSTDHNFSVEGKKFHHASEFPTLARFINAFPHATNFRLNGLGTKSKLSPHEEHIIHEWNNIWYLRTRFHLAIQTNKSAEVLLDKDVYHFEPEKIYYFNNGCVHSATNRGTDLRYHLVWDMLLTQETFDLMFNSQIESKLSFMRKTPPDQQQPTPVRRERITEYQISGDGDKLYKKWNVSRYGIKPYTFNNFYNRYAYRKFQKDVFPRIVLAPVK